MVDFLELTLSLETTLRVLLALLMLLSLFELLLLLALCALLALRPLLALRSLLALRPLMTLRLLLALRPLLALRVSSLRERSEGLEVLNSELAAISACRFFFPSFNRSRIVFFFLCGGICCGSVDTRCTSCSNNCCCTKE